MNLIKHLHLLVIGCILMQPFLLHAQPFNYTIYREADGLPAGYVQKVFEDSRGYLWLCTFGGLSRFTGREFKNYDIKDGLPGNFCDDICEDKKGILWVATRSGLCKYDGRKFSKVAAPDSGATSYFANCKVNDKNEFTCILNGRNAALINGKLQYLPTSYDIPVSLKLKYVIGTLANGNMILNSEKGIYLISPQNIGRLLFPFYSSTTYFYFHPAEKNAFYFFNESGLYHWQADSLQKIPAIDFTNQIPTALFVDKQKRIWLAIENKGIWVLDKSKCTLIDKELPGLLIPSFYQDKAGIMWISTFRGLVKLTDRFATHYTKASGLDDDDIRSSGMLWDGSIYMQTTFIKNGEPGLLPGNLTPLLNSNQFPTYVRGLLLDEQKRCWVFGYNRNIYRYQENKLQNISALVDSASSMGNFFDNRDSSTWYAKGNQLFVTKNDKRIKIISSLTNGESLHNISSVNKDYFGNVWISEQARILLLSGNQLTDFTPRFQLPQKVSIAYACSDADGVWFKTKGMGAIHFSYQQKQWKKDKTINSGNGLPGNHVHDIETDAKGNTWIATLGGLYRFTENKRIPNTYNLRSFGVAEGIDVPNWNLAFLEKDSLNNIWLGVPNGIFKINTNAIKESVAAPSVLIENISVLNNANTGKNYNLGFTGDINPPTLKHDQNDIVIHFNGIDIDNKFVRYTYQLKGRDDNWITNIMNNEAVYYNLPPGAYTFMVKAISDAGLSSKPALFSFTIKAPFWQTAWFRVALTLIAIAFIYLYIKRRDALVEKENKAALQMSNLKLTALQSQMNPHFIFNSLNSVQNYIMQQKPVEAARYLSKFSKLMRVVLDQSFNNLTSLDQIVETIKMYMELEAFRFNNEFEWELKVDDIENIVDVKLPPLLLQPYVENAIIHGLLPKQGRKTLLIHLYMLNNQLHCTIDDNGVGRLAPNNQEEGHISHGQKLTEDMLAAMKQLLQTDAVLTITDKKNADGTPSGTTVDLVIPMHS